MSVFSRLNNYLTNDVAIDLGTANTLVFVKGSGIVLNEPSVVAVDQRTRKVYAVGQRSQDDAGQDARRHQRHPPAEGRRDRGLRDHRDDAARVHPQVAEEETFRAPAHRHRVPSGITEVEKRAVRDSAEHAGAREVFLVAEPIAAAIGVGLPVDKPSGNMIIDIGGGTTEIAVIALDGIVADSSIRVGGDEMDEAIVNYVKKAYNMLIGEQTAEQIKMRIGSAFTLRRRAGDGDQGPRPGGAASRGMLQAHQRRDPRGARGADLADRGRAARIARADARPSWRPTSSTAAS